MCIEEEEWRGGGGVERRRSGVEEELRGGGVKRRRSGEEEELRAGGRGGVGVGGRGVVATCWLLPPQCRVGRGGGMARYEVSNTYTN